MVEWRRIQARLGVRTTGCPCGALGKIVGEPVRLVAPVPSTYAEGCGQTTPRRLAESVPKIAFERAAKLRLDAGADTSAAPS